jgi:hypothetical protein
MDEEESGDSKRTGVESFNIPIEDLGAIQFTADAITGEIGGYVELVRKVEGSEYPQMVAQIAFTLTVENLQWLHSGAGDLLRFVGYPVDPPDLRAVLEAVLQSDMAMREEDEGNESAILDLVRDALRKTTEPTDH